MIFIVCSNMHSSMSLSSPSALAISALRPGFPPAAFCGGDVGDSILADEVVRSGQLISWSYSSVLPSTEFLLNCVVVFRPLSTSAGDSMGSRLLVTTFVIIWLRDRSTPSYLYCKGCMAPMGILFYCHMSCV